MGDVRVAFRLCFKASPGDGIVVVVVVVVGGGGGNNDVGDSDDGGGDGRVALFFKLHMEMEGRADNKNGN